MDDCTLEFIPTRHLRPHRQGVRTSCEYDLVEMCHFVFLTIFSGNVNIPPRVGVIAEHHTNRGMKPDVLMELKLGRIRLEKLCNLRACQVRRPI